MTLDAKDNYDGNIHIASLLNIWTVNSLLRLKSTNNFVITIHYGSAGSKIMYRAVGVNFTQILTVSKLSLAIYQAHLTNNFTSNNMTNVHTCHMAKTIREDGISRSFRTKYSV